MAVSDDQAQVLITRLKRQLAVVHRVDEIRDQWEENLRDLLLESPRFLAAEVRASSAFVAYHDAYDRKQILAVDAMGLIKEDEYQIIDQLAENVWSKGQTLRPDARIFQGNYLGLPMIIGNETIGMIGIGKTDPAGEAGYQPITEDDEILVNEAATVLDTAIRNRNEHQQNNDEIELGRELDNINDEECNNISLCLSKMLGAILTKIDAKAVLIFGGGQNDFEIIASDNNGRILWQTNRQMQIEIKLLVQQARGASRVIAKEFPTDSNDRLFAGKHIRAAVAQPLVTRAGESAGVLIVASLNSLSKGHLKLIRRAAEALDTVILTRKRSDVMIRRFNKYVGADCLHTLIENPEWLNPRQEHVVILSADLVGSTEYAHEEANPFRVFDHINRYLALIGRIVKNECHGTLDKYIGDEVMGLFGTPIPDPDRCVHAVECARQILQEVANLNEQRKLSGEPVFQVKITLGLVHCIVGEVGSTDTQTDYTVIGRDVNRFFRIARYAEPGGIIVNEPLHAELRKRFRFQHMDSVAVKGVEEKLPIYRLLD